MKRKPVKILNIGKDGRLMAAVDSYYRSPRDKELYVYSENNNPGLSDRAHVHTGKTTDHAEIERYAREIRPDFAFIGPEEPLAAGIVDRLRKLGIPAVGPSASLAKLESSKSFTRALLEEYQIPGRVQYRAFKNEAGLESYLHELGEFVVKPDGLTSGKGVKVYGDHFTTVDEGLLYCQEILAAGSTVVIEEKLDGEEFSFQSFCDGKHVVDTIPIQDHKRADEGDCGPNTGGMGSYSCEDHLLPFLTEEHIRQASSINKDVAAALRDKVGEEYKGILYGSFMLTRDGLKIIEYNVRFGDPEAMNVLSLLQTDFIDVCEAIIDGTLDKLPIKFDRKATVCKYVVPNGYPNAPVKDERLDLSQVTPSPNLKIYHAAVWGNRNDDLHLTGSRAVAFVGIGDTLEAAEQIAERAASQVIGPVRHRTDIGTPALVQRRVDHMKQVLGSGWRYPAPKRRAV